MNLFMLLSVPLFLLFLKDTQKTLNRGSAMRAVLGGLLTVLALFSLYWPYASGFRLPWSFAGLYFHHFVMEYLLFPVPLVLTWFFLGNRWSADAGDEWYLTLWMGSGFVLLGLRDFLFTGNSTQDMALFLQPLIRILILTVVPGALTGLLKKEFTLLNWTLVLGGPLVLALLGVLNFWQLGWVSYLVAVPAVPAAVWYFFLRREESMVSGE